MTDKDELAKVIERLRAWQFQTPFKGGATFSEDRDLVCAAAEQAQAERERADKAEAEAKRITGWAAQYAAEVDALKRELAEAVRLVNQLHLEVEPELSWVRHSTGLDCPVCDFLEDHQKPQP